MSKKTIILTTKRETILQGDTLKKYMNYANIHDLDIRGELHCNIEMPFLFPNELIDIVMEEKPEVLIADDLDIVIADIYQDGKLLGTFKDKGVTVINTESVHDILDFNRIIDRDIKRKIKETVDQAFSQIERNEKRNCVAVITNDSSSEELRSFIEKLSLVYEKTCIIEIPEFVPFIAKHIDLCIKDSEVNKIIVYDKEIMNESFEEYLQNLQTKYNLDIDFKENYEMEQNYEIQNMSFN